jgi:vanillate/4-hydroxybenzoate decarboxylase subunit C
VVESQATGLQLPWGSEIVLEGKILSRVREGEGPFGEFTGHYSGARRTPVVEITKVSHRRNPLFEHLYLGMPWTEIDYLMGVNTCAPLHVQLKAAFPEVQAVNALYTHGLVVIVSTKRRFGGFAKAVRDARAVHPTRARLRQARDCRGRDHRSFQSAASDVGAFDQVQP